ncbi:MAG: hypothetical protein RLW61_17655 [Gammaproteobacteria bacterium]
MRAEKLSVTFIFGGIMVVSQPCLGVGFEVRNDVSAVGRSGSWYEDRTTYTVADSLTTETAISKTSHLVASPGRPLDASTWFADVRVNSLASVTDVSEQPRFKSRLDMSIDIKALDEQLIGESVYPTGWTTLDVSVENYASMLDTPTFRSPGTQGEKTIRFIFLLEGEQRIRNELQEPDRIFPAQVDRISSALMLDAWNLAKKEKMEADGFVYTHEEPSLPACMPLGCPLEVVRNPGSLTVAPILYSELRASETTQLEPVTNPLSSTTKRNYQIDPVTKLLEPEGDSEASIEYFPFDDVYPWTVSCELDQPCEIEFFLKNTGEVRLSAIDAADANAIEVFADFGSTITLLAVDMLDNDGSLLDFSAESPLGVDYAALSTPTAVPLPLSVWLLSAGLGSLIAWPRAIPVARMRRALDGQETGPPCVAAHLKLTKCRSAP